METTFGIIKPDATAAGHMGEIISAIEKAGFRLRALRLVHLTPAQAAGFYRVHEGKPFFAGLIEFMSSGPCVLMALQRDDAIAHWRRTMGATDPTKAEPGTLRARFGTAISRNAVHGSDAPETAAAELGYFFTEAFDLVHPG